MAQRRHSWRVANDGRDYRPFVYGDIYSRVVAFRVQIKTPRERGVFLRLLHII